MKRFAIALAGLLITTGAFAQGPPAPDSEPPSQSPPMAGPRGDMERGDMGRDDMGRGEMRRGDRRHGEMMGHHRMMMQSKGARFRFRRGESRIAVKCADDEPTRVCVDATLQLLDKIMTFR